MLDMRYFLVLLAVAGIAVSGLALQVHFSTDSAPCSINEKWDCGIVNHSIYSEVEHIPVAILGLAGYSVLGFFAWVKQRGMVLAAALPGLGFSLYLTHIEKDVLGVWCIYCVTSLGLICAITVLSFLWTVWARWTRRPEPEPWRQM